MGAFLDATSYADPTQTRADLIANAIEVLRVAALSSYENRSISSGVLILDTLRENAKANIDVESSPGNGTRVTITFERRSD